MAAPLDSLGVVTLFVADRDRSKEFYARVLAADAVWEDDNSAVFKLDNLMINLLQRGEPVRELLGSRAAAEPGASFLLTVWVDDCDAAYAELGERGAKFDAEPVDRSWGVRTAAFADPDGYLWEIAQQLPSGV
jgi:catechol 2,3-dioxygenase-like lactoylglutathione lyase family enzyme